MADQTIKLANFPDSGSHERVAFDLMREILSSESRPANLTHREHVLGVYALCRKAAYGAYPAAK